MTPQHSIMRIRDNPYKASTLNSVGVFGMNRRLLVMGFFARCLTTLALVWNSIVEIKGLMKPAALQTGNFREGLSGTNNKNMKNQEEKQSKPSVSGNESWSGKLLRNVCRNRRVKPDKVELPDCDFFIVAPRRTLRILKPVTKNNVYYETIESKSECLDNFFTCWSRRPHSLNNCRCSFRSGRLSANEERLINAQLNHIRNSLSEAERSGGNCIEELERRVSINLKTIHNCSKNDREESTSSSSSSHEDPSTKGKIVKDLEKYINDLLEEILEDTVKSISESNNNTCRENPATNTVSYVNSAFVGSPNDPDSLDFYLNDEKMREPCSDCIDSGIHSVETFDFQVDELSLEKSLMKIIDVKFGKVEIEEKDEEMFNFRNLKLEMNNDDSSVPRMSTFRERLNDQIHYRQSNNDDNIVLRRNKKPVIVFLHGFGSSAEIFENQLRYFSNLGYSCVAPDFLGHGMSSAPRRSKDYQFNKIFHDLELVLQHYAFKPNQKCVLVGHNYGCSFATALAGKYENKIHQLVLISGGGPIPLAPPSSESSGRCILRATLTPLLMCGLHRDILYSAKGRQHPYCGNETQEQWPSHMKYVLNGMIWPEGDHVFHRRISIPTLLVHGLRDDKVSLVQECQMERTMVKAYLEAIPSAAHIPMIDSVDQLNHMIHCFIDLWKNKR